MFCNFIKFIQNLKNTGYKQSFRNPYAFQVSERSMVHSKRSEIKNGSLRPFGPFQHIDTGYFKVERSEKFVINMDTGPSDVRPTFGKNSLRKIHISIEIFS